MTGNRMVFLCWKACFPLLENESFITYCWDFRSEAFHNQAILYENKGWPWWLTQTNQKELSTLFTVCKQVKNHSKSLKDSFISHTSICWKHLFEGQVTYTGQIKYGSVFRKSWELLSQLEITSMSIGVTFSPLYHFFLLL